jgi:thioesterase domain-containing protein/acyl carrier protein
MQMNGEVREYVGVPVYYSFGFGRCRALAHCGGRCFLPSAGFDPLEVVGLLRSGRINAISAVPAMWRLLLARPELLHGLNSRVKWIEIGSQFMSGGEKRRMLELFPAATIVQHYGLTEASRTTFLSLGEKSCELESVGRPTGAVQVAIGDSSTILIRGPHIGSGVVVNGMVRRLADADGWLHTNDQGSLSDDGCLYFFGRSDDVINCGGIKLAPAAVEQSIAQHLPVPCTIGVARIPDQLRGDGILVAFESTTRLSAGAVKDAAVSALATLGLRAAASIRVVECGRVPTTPTGKVRRAELARLFARSEIAELPGRSSRSDLPEQDEDLGHRLLTLVGERLGSAGVTADQPIAEGLGDSLGLIDLILSLEEQFGVSLSLGDLYRARTVTGIARVIRIRQRGPSAEACRYAVPIGHLLSPDKPKLFVVPGSYGSVGQLQELAVSMHEAVQVYALEYHGLRTGEVPRRTIEDLAEDFVGDLKRLQPKGPYLLLGYSGGGVVASEMSRRLIEDAQSVAGVILIDARLPPIPPYQAPFSFLERQKIRSLESHLRGRGHWDVVRRGIRHGKRLLLDPHGAPPRPWLDGLTGPRLRAAEVNVMFQAALRRFRVPTVATDLHYFRAAGGRTFRLSSGTIDFVDGNAHRVDQRDNGWGRFFQTSTSYSVPGDHYSLIEAPFVAELGARIARVVERLWSKPRGS